MIRKILALALLAAMMAGILGCGSDRSRLTETENQQTGESVQVYYNTKWDQKTLKVLAIGNSYTVDALTYLYDIAKADGVEQITLGNLYIGGCSLEMHNNNAKTGAADYIYYKNTDGNWTETPNATILQGIQDEAWDVIVLAQQSMNAGIPSSFDGHLEELVSFVRQNRTNPDCQLAWHMTWAYPEGSTYENFAPFNYDELTMYNAITSSVQQKVLPIGEFSIVIPSGTVIQNGRACFGERFSRDRWHHLSDFGKFMVGYQWYSSLIGEPILELKFVPEDMELTKQMELDILNCLTAAFINPFEPKK